MENHDIYLQHTTAPRSSSSSAIDLTRTPAGIATSAPPSPSLDPSDSQSLARRRTSWGNRLVDAGQDPLYLDPTMEFGQSSMVSPARHGHNDSIYRQYTSNDDPFESPLDDNIPLPREFSHSDNNMRYGYGSQHGGVNTYSTSQSGPSTISLIAGPRDFDMDGQMEDDEARLTSNMSHQGGTGADWDEGYSEDPERSAGGTPRRRTLRYSVTPSPLKKTGTAIKTVSKNIRRVSLRVVNLAGAGLENQLRLAEDESGGVRRSATKDSDAGVEPISDLHKALPIRGRTLGCLGPESSLRLALYKFLTYEWTEPTILLLIIINAAVLTIQASRSLTLPTSDGTSFPPPARGYFHSWEDYVLFGLFIIFTLEAFARICVSGFLFDPEVPMSTILMSPFVDHNPNMTTIASSNPTSSVTRQASLNRGFSITKRLDKLSQNFRRPFALSARVDASSQNPPPTDNNSNPNEYHIPEKLIHTAQNVHSIIRKPEEATFFSRALRSDNSDTISLPFRLSIRHIHDKTQRNVPYLRHSWSRIDFVAILSFWITFALASAGLERGSHHIGVFRAMSVIRTARLLTITSGTTTIMHSLKTARPLLTSVAYFVLFAMVLFSIIGVQSFKDEIQLESQFCGGYIDPETLNVTTYIPLSGGNPGSAKGYICPLGQICKEMGNPFANVESFDTIYYAALQVVIVASANGWTPLMYSMVDSEFFISCFFFIVCVIVLNFWLINLFVAVITNTFSAIRSETKKSAFGAAPPVPIADEEDDGWAIVDGRKNAKTNMAKMIYDYTRWCWVFLALASLALQASRTVDMETMHELFLYYGELGITIAFDLEIILRVLATLPDWRNFFVHGNNWLDAFLAIGTSIIQIPAIQNSEVYPWFTIFQLARFYRVILEVPRMRPLLLAVFGNMYGLANMSLFLILVNYIAALVAVQLLRGDLGQDTTMNFGQLFTSFLAIYQVFSSENWTNILYETTGAEVRLGQTVIVAIFITAWMLFANFIVLQMFIAVINENFDVAEEAKKGKQASSYWASHQPQEGKANWMRRLNPYRWIKANPVKVKVENLPSNLVLPMQKTLVQDYGTRGQSSRSTNTQADGTTTRGPRHYPSKSLTALQRLFAGDLQSNDVPLATLRHARHETVERDEETERHLELLASVNADTATVEDINDALHERRAQKADFIRNHPSYDKTFWIFSQKNVIRRGCQKVVQPSNGERIFGASFSPIAHPIFQLILLLTVFGGIAVESVATPIYRRNYYLTNGFHRGAWFDIAETAFGFTLVAEFLIKIVADGFLFTPNAYIRSIWNILDFIIMVGLLINVTTGLIFIGGLSRLTRSLKALRALRLITLIDRMRNTFQSLILSGATRILDAAVLAILYMIPYAVWGLNIFSGKMNQCNDGAASGISDCTNEFTNSAYGQSFGFLAPRVWDNPAPSTTFSFDTFRSSLLILFEIVSLEGWTDVMGIATSITGRNQQPQTNASQVNAIFFLIYNLLGGVVILTLFISIIIGNFSSKTGSAFLTAPQREWIDLQKLFKRQRPSKRPQQRPDWPVRAWCFDRAVHKHGWWSRAMTFVFILHIIALMTQTFTTQSLADTFRNDFFLVMMFIYLIDVGVRFFGLGWTSFRANGWNIFDIVVAGGSFVTTLIVRFGSSGFAIQQLQKLFLVSIAFKLVQRTNSLNMLFKTAVASLPVILSLLGLWLILFVFFAILYVEVFSMTKWSTAETRNQNYSSLGSSLVMLAFMSTGEGWNQYMHDFALVYPRCTNSSQSKSESDCGSVGWAFVLFISWNLLSMYIFVNMFTGVVVENFSYVFQASGRGAKSITREQMRAFKKVWAECADAKTGYLEKSEFVRFFSKLSGIFEVKVYPTESSIPNIMAACQSSNYEQAISSRVVEGVDIPKLSDCLDGIDFSSIRKRRAIYSRLYHEASISHQQGRGISFTDMLLLLAHHKLIVDREALVLKDLVVRTETNKLVTDLVNLDRVRSLLKTISCRRRFLATRERLRSMRFEQQEIPFIVVDSLPETPPGSTRDISTATFDGTFTSPVPEQRYSTPDVSLVPDILGARLQRSSRRISDISMLSTDIGYKSQRSSISGEEDPQNILSSLQNSVWGDLMMEAASNEHEHE